MAEHQDHRSNYAQVICVYFPFIALFDPISSFYPRSRILQIPASRLTLYFLVNQIVPSDCPSRIFQTEICPIGIYLSEICPTGIYPTGICSTQICPAGKCPDGNCPIGIYPTKICPTGICPTVIYPSEICPTGICPTGIYPMSHLNMSLQSLSQLQSGLSSIYRRVLHLCEVPDIQGK